MSEARLGDRLVGDGHPTLIVMEAGATHTGLESAKALTKAAADGGADAVKFQTMTSDNLMATTDTMISFETPEGAQQERVYDAMKRRELTPDEWGTLRRYAADLGLLFISTPSDPETVDLLDSIDASAIKVAKSDQNHFFLVDYIASKGKPVILDGRERFEDVARSVEICEARGVKNIIIMHCPSGYPSALAGVHLSAIPFIKGVFNYPVGYSDHSVGSAMNFAAVALGASLVEKTITLDKSTNAVEHFMSVEPSEVPELVTGIRSIESAMGDPRVIFSSRVNDEMRRSMFVDRAIKQGEAITLENITFKRPGTHWSAQHYELAIGKRARRDLAPGVPLLADDVE